eukprot:SAG11_NODE_18060_length_501_cov_0.621891_1_plen_47_part_00
MLTPGTGRLSTKFSIYRYHHIGTQVLFMKKKYGRTLTSTKLMHIFF